jgi:hypothetical protein
MPGQASSILDISDLKGAEGPENLSNIEEWLGASDSFASTFSSLGFSYDDRTALRVQEQSKTR